MDAMNNNNDDVKLVTNYLLAQLIKKLNLTIKRLENIDCKSAGEFKKQKEKLTPLYGNFKRQRQARKREALRDILFLNRNILN